jgi:tripartite-type tricarboxylate transporter receptor subunit TctC
MTFLYGHTLVNFANIAGITDFNYTAFTLGPTFAKNPAQGLYVNAEKYADLNAFIEAAKAAPGQLKAATEVGAYTYYELLAFEKAAGIDLDLVDAGSNSDKITAMLSGQIDLMPGAYLNCKEYIEAGQFVCIGAPTAEAYEITPDVPVLKEEGIDLVYPDCDYSFYFPADTDPAIIAYYDELVAKVLEDPDAQKALTDLPVMPYYLTSEESAANEETMYNTIKEIADSLA